MDAGAGHRAWRVRRFMMLALLVGVSAAAGARVSADTPEADVEDDALEESEAFWRTHEVMGRQQDRMHDLLDGFTLGDRDLIDESAEAIGQDMESVPLEAPPGTTESGEAWDAVRKIAEYAARLRAEAKAGRREEALQSFHSMIGQCMRCHEAKRDWGRIPESEADLLLERP